MPPAPTHQEVAPGDLSDHSPILLPLRTPRVAGGRRARISARRGREGARLCALLRAVDQEAVLEQQYEEHLYQLFLEEVEEDQEAALQHEEIARVAEHQEQATREIKLRENIAQHLHEHDLALTSRQ
jgi:hypothetical protein